MFKKVSILCLALMMVVLVGCSSNSKESNGSDLSKLSLEDMMTKVYEGIAEDKLPNLSNIPVTKDVATGFLGTDTLDFKEALASEPMMSSIAHSVVLVRMNDGADIEKAKTEIKEKVDPRKWICVEVDPNNVIVDSKDNVIILIMSNEVHKEIHDNFKKI